MLNYMHVFSYNKTSWHISLQLQTCNINLIYIQNLLKIHLVNIHVSMLFTSPTKPLDPCLTPSPCIPQEPRLGRIHSSLIDSWCGRRWKGDGGRQSAWRGVWPWSPRRSRGTCCGRWPLCRPPWTALDS